MKGKAYCIGDCGTELDVKYCCTSYDCGCMGLPIDMPVCSEECYNKYMQNDNKKLCKTK